MTHMNEITFIRPDDWHCHLRDEPYLKHTVNDVATRFNRAVVMPNLMPPIKTIQQAKTYYDRIKVHIPKFSDFQPLMTLYLTESTTVQEIQTAKQSEMIVAFKLYPAGTTTYSQAGVKKLQAIYPLLEIMQSINLTLLIHGEVVDPTVDIFDREAVFIERELRFLIETFPQLRIVLEHISTKIAVDFVLAASSNLSATITPHHLILTWNDIFSNGIQPHHYCLPILKGNKEQHALIQAATSGNPKFFLGTDSAPHSQTKKQSRYGAAGIYNVPTAIEIYTEVFDRQNALDKLENFASRSGAQFYGLPINHTKITLVKQPWQVPKSFPFGNELVVPLLAGKTLQWQIKSHEHK